MRYLTRFSGVYVLFPTFFLFLACGDSSPKRQNVSELQIAMLASFASSPLLGFEPPQVNKRSDGFSDDLELILSKMIEFQPKKIFIESIPGSRNCDAINKEFRSFVFNQDLIAEYPSDLTRQLGFRLASKLGHHKLFCSDASRKQQEQYDQEAFLQLGGDELRGLNHSLKRIEKTLFDYLSLGNFAHAFEFLNEEEQLLELQQTRMSLYQNRESKAALAWGERNHQIVENLKRNTSEADDRILVIFNSMNLYDLKEEIERDSLDSQVLFFQDL